MTDAPAPANAPPKSFAALRHRGARHYMIGGALAMMADNIEHVISYWILYEKFHSPALGGFAVIAHWLPFLLFSFYAGSLADRFDPRRVIQAGMVMFSLVSIGWGTLFATDSLEMWHACVLLVVHGLAGVLWSPSAQLLIHDIVGPAELQSGIRLMATSNRLGILAGPAVGGALMLSLGPTAGIFVNALIYMPLTLWLWKAPYGPAVSGRRKPSQRMKGFAELRRSVRDIAGNPMIVSMTLLSGTAALIVGGAYQAQMPEFAHDLGGGGEGLRYSLLLSASAGGALFAGVLLESRNMLPAKPRTAFVLAMLWCVAIGSFAVTGNFMAALLCLFTAGFLDLSFNAMTRTLTQLHAPAELRGRVIGVFNMASLGSRSISGVTVGLGGSLVGIHASLAVSAALLLTAVATLFRWSLSRVPAASATQQPAE